MKTGRKGRKKSFVWDHFRISKTDPRKAICNNCGAEMVRGRDARSFGTSSLANHIKYCKKLVSRPSPYGFSQKRKSAVCVLVDEPGQDEDGDGVKIRRMFGDADDSQASDLSDVLSLPKTSEMYISPEAGFPIEDPVGSKRMDLVHSAMLMNVLYQQHKSGKLCDMTLISSAQNSSLTDTLLGSEKKKRQKTYKAHSFVLAGLSEKIRTLVEMGSRTIELKDVTAFGLHASLEIVYTGKLRKSSPLTFYEAHQVWKSASDLGIKYVHEYLATEHPQVAKWILEDSLTPEPMRAFTMQDLTETRETDDLVDLHSGGEQYVEITDDPNVPVKNFEEFIDEHHHQQEEHEEGQGEVVHLEDRVKMENDESLENQDSLVEITFAKS